MSISFTPAISSMQTFSSSVTASPETRIDQVEQEVEQESQFVSEEKRAEYKITMRRTLAEIRSTIASMRALGRSEYQINRAVDGLLEKFYASSSTFFEKNTQFDNAKALVLQSNQAVGTTISQSTLKSRTISLTPYNAEGCNKANLIWKSTTDLPEFKQVWVKSDQNTKRCFIEQLNKDQSQNGTRVKDLAASFLYKSLGENNVTEWPAAHVPAYYHATPNLKSLMGILKGGQVNVSYEKLFQGAFVSTKPERIYGDYVFVFNRSIEWSADLAGNELGQRNGFVLGNDYWAGFAKPIPVNNSTLIKIKFYGRESDFAVMTTALKDEISKGLVVEHADGNDQNDAPHVVPSEWPSQTYADALSDMLQKILLISKGI